MTDGPSCLRYRHFDQTMKTLITAWLTSTEGERVTSLFKTQVVAGDKLYNRPFSDQNLEILWRNTNKDDAESCKELK